MLIKDFFAKFFGHTFTGYSEINQKKDPFRIPAKRNLNGAISICYAFVRTRPLVIIGPFYYKKSQFGQEIQSPTITGHFSFFTAFYYEVEQESVFTRSIFIEP